MSARILLLVLFAVAVPVHPACPDPNEVYRGSCYFMDRERNYTYSEATQYCMEHEAKLATILDQDEQEFLVSFLKNGSSTAVWMGLSDAEEEGNFVWNDSTPLTYQNWLEGSPNNYDNADCGIIRSWDGKWNDLNCEKPYGVICEGTISVIDCEAFPEEPGRVVTYDNEPVDGIYPGQSKATFGCEGAMNLVGETEAVCLTTGWTEAPSCVAKACPDPNEVYRDSCYFVDRERKYNYSEAVQYCAEYNATLATILDQGEQEFLVSFLNDSSTAAWMGLSDAEEEGNFVWNDGTPLTYQNWLEGSPNNYNNADCGIIRSWDGKWNDLNCEKPYGVICMNTIDVIDCEAFPEEPGRVVTYDNSPIDGIYPQQSKATFGCEGAMDLVDETEAVCLTTGWTEAPSCVAKACPDPNEVYRGSCYFVDRERKYNYSEAAQYCAAYDAKLATILDQNEQEFLASFLKNGLSTAAWMGLSDAAEEGNFVWNDGTPLTYQNWLEGSPNNYNNADCGIIRSWDGKWNDLNCEKLYGVICESTVYVIDCEAIPEEPGRVVTYDNEPIDGVYPQQSKATFGCEGAMDLVGETEAVCLATGWTEAPTCV